MNEPIQDRLVGTVELDRVDVAPGRRLRAFTALIHCTDATLGKVALRANHSPFMEKGFPATYNDAFKWICSEEGRAIRAELADLPLRINVHGNAFLREKGEFSHAPDPELHKALQDLGDEINEDIHEACFAFDDPDLFYPGVDDGIEPVTDEHVELVVWALQRELLRELRLPPGWSPMDGHAPCLPAVTLVDLPWRVQRALVERRRLRYQEFGIGYEQWKQGKWSLWDVPEDADWVPRRQQRLAAG